MAKQTEQSWTFGELARRTACALGTPAAFMLACATIVVWAVSGPVFGYSDTWQLIINTGTTVVTFLMVFLVQNTQNRDARAPHLKLDELLRSVKDARNKLIDLEHCTRTRRSNKALKRREEAHTKAAADQTRRASSRSLSRFPPAGHLIGPWLRACRCCPWIQRCRGE